MICINIKDEKIQCEYTDIFRLRNLQTDIWTGRQTYFSYRSAVLKSILVDLYDQQRCENIQCEWIIWLPISIIHFPTPLHTHTHTCTHPYTHTHIHIHKQAHSHAHTRTYTRKYVHALTQT